MKRCLEKDLFGVCFVCAGGGEGMIKESEGGYEGVVCLWLQAVYAAAHSHTWQPRGTALKIRNLTSTQPFFHTTLFLLLSNLFLSVTVVKGSPFTAWT